MEKNYHYRSAVGPPDKYDIIGALQFCVLVNLGLREYHKLLDIGCGSLRGGRLFVPYLSKGHYFGLEPDSLLVRDGIKNELGGSILIVKAPQFVYSEMFDLSFGDVTFDYVLAQSIFSHASKRQIKKCLSEVRRVLAPGGKFIFTYFRGDADYEGDTWAQQPDARYTERWMRQVVKEHGLSYERLDYEHPSGQTWVLTEHR